LPLVADREAVVGAGQPPADSQRLHTSADARTDALRQKTPTGKEIALDEKKMDEKKIGK